MKNAESETLKRLKKQRVKKIKKGGLKQRWKENKKFCVI